MIEVAPQSALAVATVAGTTRIPIIERSLVDPSATPATPWFTKGAVIEIGPGQPDAEEETITGTAPLTVAHPLKSAHAAGEMVTVLTGSRG